MLSQSFLLRCRLAPAGGCGCAAWAAQYCGPQPRSNVQAAALLQLAAHPEPYSRLPASALAATQKESAKQKEQQPRTAHDEIGFVFIVLPR